MKTQKRRRKLLNRSSNEDSTDENEELKHNFVVLYVDVLILNTYGLWYKRFFVKLSGTDSKKGKEWMESMQMVLLRHTRAVLP